MNPETPDRQGKSPRPRWVIAILGFLFAVVLLAGVLVAKQRAGHQRNLAEIQRRLDAIHTAGDPLTAEDMAKLYPDPPPEHDAIILLTPALDKLSIPDEPTNLLFFDVVLPRSAPLDPSLAAEGQKWLDQNQAAFALIPWGWLEHAWVGSGFTNGFLSLTEAPFSKMRHLVRLLCLSAVLQAEQQHPHEAMEFLRRAAIVGNTFKNDVKIHFLFKAGMQSLIAKALERVINRSNPGDADLSSFPNCLTLTNIGATKEIELLNDRAAALFLAGLYKPGTNQLTKGAASAGQRLRNFQWSLLYHDEDLLQYLDWADHCAATLDLPASNAIPTLRNMEKLQDEAAKNRHVLLVALTGDLADLSFRTTAEPHLSGHFLGELKADAHARLAVVALAVERWRLSHGGQVPGSLAELAPNFLPAVPPDPFDGRPLRYKKQAKGYVIYSIGEDFTDDGGREQPAEATHSFHYDITFTVDK